MAKTPRKWTGARTPSGLKRVRTAERRHAILQPRRSSAKTLVRTALTVATTQPEGTDPAVALAEAVSALDRAAKVGAIHPNAAARRKSRLARKVNAALGGGVVQTAARVTKTTGTAAATKAAKARIAASKAAKAKGAQTAAGKARAALSKTTRAEAAPASGTAQTTGRPAARTATAKAAARAAAPKSATAPKSAAAAPEKSPAAKAPAKVPAPKATAKPATAAKATAKPAGATRKAAPNASSTTRAKKTES